MPTSTTFSLRNLKWRGKLNITRYIPPTEKLLRCLNAVCNFKSMKGLVELNHLVVISAD